MKKVAVISQNKILARSVELEVLSYRMDCDVFLKPPKQLSEYCAIVVDSDSIDDIEFVSTKSFINIGNNSAPRQNCVANLSYPFLLNEFLDALDNCVENNKKVDVILRQEITNEDKNLFYFSDIDKTLLAFGQRINVSEYELRVLERLCKTPGVAVSRMELSDILTSSGDTNIVDVYVCHLRKKLEKLSDKKVIYTIREKGYMTYYSLERN